MIDMVVFIKIIIVFIFISFLINISSTFQNKRHFRQAKRLSEKKSESNIPLFTWIADEPSIEKLLFDILNNKKTTDNFKENFIEFKKLVKEYMGNELEDYYLIRDILKQRLGGSVTNLFNKLSKSFIPAVVITLITTMLTNNFAESMSQSLLLLAIIILTFIFIVAILSFSFLRKRNRIEILLLVIEQIIIEKEKDL